MKRYGVFLFTALLATILPIGCAATSVPPVESTSIPDGTPSTQVAVVVPPDRILIQFETLDCFCSLGDVERSLLEMEAVAALDWEASNSRVWLVFLDSRRPTDEQIRLAVRYTPVKIKEILRP